MNIRAFKLEDIDDCRKLHAKQGLPYPFPKLVITDGQVRENPLFFIKLVGEEDGRVVQAAFAHLTAECYFLLDNEWKTPQERLLAFLAMMDVGRELAWKPGGLDDLQAFLPPQIEKRFGKRLVAHHWRKSQWQCYVTELER